MKGIGSVFRVISVLLCLLSLLLCLISCSGDKINSDQKNEVLEYFRDKMTETLPITSDTVYWTKNGAVYHLYPDCRFLSRSDEVRHGTLAQSGKSRLCGACAEKSELIAYETESGADETVPFVDSETSQIVPDTTFTGPVTTEDTTAASPNTDEREPHLTSEDSSAPDPPESEPPANDVEPPPNEIGVPGTVYWTPNGSVWHIDPNCPSLARSKVVNSGTVEQSGKSRGCKKCTPGY